MESALSEVNGALRGARWFMSPYTWNIVRGLQDANGNPLIAPWSGTAPKQVIGYPVTLSYQLPDSGDDAASTPFVALGNPRYLVHGDRVGLEIKYYDATQFSVTNCEAFFRFRFRAAFDVDQPASFAVLSTAS